MSGRRAKFDIRRAGKPILFALAGCLVLNILASLLLVQPKVLAYNRLEKESEPEVQALKKLREDVEAREAYLGALQKAESDLVELRVDVLSTRERRMVEIQAEVGAICDEFRIDLRQVNFNNENLDEEELDRHVMVIPLEAGYGALRQFLHAVEKSDKFIVVEQVSIGESNEGGVILQLNITLATYFDFPEHLRKQNQVRGPGRRRA